MPQKILPLILPTIFSAIIIAIYWAGSNFLNFDTKNFTAFANIGSDEKVKFGGLQEIGKLSMPMNFLTNGDEKKYNILIKGATKNSGKMSLNNRLENFFDSGVAEFGSGDEILFVHYNSDFKNRYVRLGGSEFNDTVYSLEVGDYDSTIFKLPASGGYTFYLIRDNFNVPVDYYRYTIIGRKPDGTWQKYIDSDSACERQLGKTNSQEIFSINQISVSEDAITMSYSKFTFATAPMNVDGEIKFTWDDKEKWFTVSSKKF